LGLALTIRVVILSWRATMNLQQFIQYRQTCPLCDGQLSLGFNTNSRKKHRTKHVDNKLQFIFKLDPLKRGSKDHEAAYCFDPENSSFSIEFYTREGRYVNLSPLFLMEHFKGLHNNLNAFSFDRNCYSCYCYQYSSGSFQINLKEKYIDNMFIHNEKFGLSYPIERVDNQLGYIEEYRVYRITNFYEDNSTYLEIDKSSLEGDANIVAVVNYNSSGTHIKLPLISFTSKEKMINRLNALLLFI
jgi:hypothetical protein